MTSLLSSGDLISDRYASALYDLAAEKKIVYLVLEDLVFLQKCIQENKDLKLLAKSPLITSSDKLNIFEKILSKRKADNINVLFSDCNSFSDFFGKHHSDRL